MPSQQEKTEEILLVVKDRFIKYLAAAQTGGIVLVAGLVGDGPSNLAWTLSLTLFIIGLLLLLKRLAEDWKQWGHLGMSAVALDKMTDAINEVPDDKAIRVAAPATEIAARMKDASEAIENSEAVIAQSEPIVDYHNTLADGMASKIDASQAYSIRFLLGGVFFALVGMWGPYLAALKDYICTLI